MLCFGCIRRFLLVIIEQFSQLLGAFLDCFHTQEESNYTVISETSVFEVEENLFMASDDYDHCGISRTITLLFANILNIFEGKK
jgi:hypothetical protein